MTTVGVPGSQHLRYLMLGTQNTPLPPSHLSSYLRSLQQSPALLSKKRGRRVIGDRELYGLVETGRQNEKTLRNGMRKHIDNLLSQCSQLDDATLLIKVDQEVDLRSHFLKTNYNQTPGFKAYRNHLDPTISSHLFPPPPASVGSSSTTSFYTAPLAATCAATSVAQVPSIPSRSSGACLVDVTMYGSQHRQGERLPKIKAINGTVELKNLKEDAVKGTPLKTPSFDPASTSSGINKLATEELSQTLQSYVKEGAAQTIWYGALEQEMMMDGNGPLPMVMTAYQVNQYFLRILLLGKSILVESEVAHEETTLQDWLEDVKSGRKFPHHLSTLRGAKALSDFVLVSRELILQSMSNQDAVPDASNATTGTTNLFHAFTHIERTPEAVLEAGLGHATGIRADRKATKLQTESDQPSESRNRTSTGGTDGGPSGSGGGTGGRSMVNPKGGSLGQGQGGGDAGSGVGSTGFSGTSFKSCAGSEGKEWLPPSPAGSMDRMMSGCETLEFQHQRYQLPLSPPLSPPPSPLPGQNYPHDDDELGSATSAAEFYQKKPLKLQMQTLHLRGYKVHSLPIHKFEQLLQQILPSVGTGPGRPM